MKHRPRLLVPLLAAHEEQESEWWYYHGHLVSPSRRFAFHLAFFRFRIDDIRLGGVIPLKLAAEHFRVAHFAVTELDGGRFHYGFTRSLHGDAGASTDRYRTWIQDWSAEETPAGHHLRASLEQVQMDLIATPLKPALRRLWNAQTPQPMRPYTGEFCLTRMNATGCLRIEGENFPVNGSAWMDREFGDFPLKHEIRGWDWFGMQFENGTELRLYQINQLDHAADPSSSLAFIDVSGKPTWLAAHEFSVVSQGHWTSPRTGIAYPTDWLVTVPQLGAILQLRACVRCSELDTRGSGNVIYWEGPAQVTGQMQGAAVSGQAFVELVGHGGDLHRTGVFDFGHNRLGVWDSLFNELHQHRCGPGVSITDGEA